MSQEFKAILFDLSGVLYEGESAIQGAAATIRAARDRNLILRFVTNTATKPAGVIIADLAAMQIQIQPDELYTAPKAAIEYVKQRGLRPFCLVHESIKKDFSDLPQQDPNCVILGDARDDLNYQSLNRAFGLCQSGAELIGIGMNKYFKDESGLKLDAGPFIKALEWAADCEATIMGKPSGEFYQQVVRSTGARAAECLMIGDDVSADVQGAMDAGLQGCLVKTGKYQPSDLKLLPAGARLLDSVSSLLQALPQ